ncbi:MAG: alpha/beta fold hydrolase [Promethearchaeota archaeon]
MQSSTFTYQDKNGEEIFAYKWAPDSAPKAAVQISHGMAEHAARYARLAEKLTSAGYICYADDHHGHGKTAKTLDRAGILPFGWEGVVQEMHDLKDIIEKENPEIPVFLLGHSWGSMLSQNFMENYGSELKGVILSGTTGSQPILGLTLLIIKFLVKKNGANTPGTFANKLSFQSFNDAFKPNKTEFDWLSRDEIEVQKYIDDEWCGFVCSYGYFAELLKMLKITWNKNNEKKIPTDLPIFMVAGAMDPVSGQTKTIDKLLKRYEKYGIKDLSHKYYSEDHHEIFNEINRDEVSEDVVSWMDKHL